MNVDNQDVNKVNILLFGGLELVYGDTHIHIPFMKSRKAQMLTAYLILKRGEPVSQKELAQAVWGKSIPSNMGNALNVLLCRTRNFLTAVNENLYDCFVVSNRSFRWNSDITGYIDVFSVEKTCALLLSDALPLTERNEALVHMLKTCRESLLPEISDEAWVESYTNNLYFRISEAANHVLVVLREEGEWGLAMKLCALCMEVLPNTENWQEQRVYAQMMLHRRFNTLEKHMESVHASRVAAWESNQTKIYANELDFPESVGVQTTSQDLTDIRMEVPNWERTLGAIFCSYGIFKHIYHLQRQSAERSGRLVYLAIMRISGSTEGQMQALALEEAMQRLGRVLQTSLRKGDAIARHSPSQYIIFLQGTANENADSMLEGVMYAFYEEVCGASIQLEYEHTCLSNKKSEHEAVKGKNANMHAICAQ